MRYALIITGFLFMAGLCGAVPYNPIMQAPDIPPGWTPAQASDWTGVKIQYAEAVHQFGVDSPQAERAHARMNAMARVLRPDEIHIPQVITQAGTNGTMAKPEVFDQWVPPPQNDSPNGQFTPQDPLNIPPQ
jgi:hypothetical protein